MVVFRRNLLNVVLVTDLIIGTVSIHRTVRCRRRRHYPPKHFRKSSPPPKPQNIAPIKLLREPQIRERRKSVKGNLYFYIPFGRVGKKFRLSHSVSDLISPRAPARKDWADVVARWHRVSGYHKCSSAVNHISDFSTDRPCEVRL
jgi:hypothetical protein